MGIANAQRSLDYVRYLTEVSKAVSAPSQESQDIDRRPAIPQFISQPEWTNVIQMFGVINEPRGAVIGQDNIGSLLVKLLLRVPSTLR